MCFLRIGCLNCLYAQTTISGQIVDEADSPLPYVNVLLLSTVDSSMVSGTVAEDNGSFTLLCDHVEPGYLISFSMLGYSEHRERISTPHDNQSIELGKIILQGDQINLDAVTVKAKKPLYEKQIDRLVVNIDNTISLSGTSALDVLKRSPGVLINQQSSAISLNGKTDVAIMLDGKMTRMPTDAVIQLLAGMNSDNIKKIELIHTPPANFDAEGSSVINIELKKGIGEGFSGGISANLGYGEDPKAGLNVNFNLRQGPVNIYGNYGARYTPNPQTFGYTKSLQTNGDSFENINESRRDPTRQTNQNGVLGIDFGLSERTIIGVLGSINWSHWYMEAVNQTDNYQNGVLTDQITIHNEEVNHKETYLLNVNFQHEFRNESVLNVDLEGLIFLERIQVITRMHIMHFQVPSLKRISYGYENGLRWILRWLRLIILSSRKNEFIWKSVPNGQLIPSITMC